MTAAMNRGEKRLSRLFRTRYMRMNGSASIMLSFAAVAVPTIMRQGWRIPLRNLVAAPDRDVARFGADRFMVNSDYPHGLGGAGQGMSDLVRDLDGLSDGEKDQLLGLSAGALFGIDPTTRKQVRNGVAAVVAR